MILNSPTPLTFRSPLYSASDLLSPPPSSYSSRFRRTSPSVFAYSTCISPPKLASTSLYEVLGIPVGAMNQEGGLAKKGSKLTKPYFSMVHPLSIHWREIVLHLVVSIKSIKTPNSSLGVLLISLRCSFGYHDSKGLGIIWFIQMNIEKYQCSFGLLYSSGQDAFIL